MSQVRVPEHTAAAARAFIEGKAQPATPRDAATVMLLRAAGARAAGAAGTGAAGTGAAGTGAPAGGPAPAFEVYMLRRKPSMAFAPGAYVFPGGSVDQRDADEEVAWAGPAVDHWGRVFDAPHDLARALVCAAVRETFEESGVLLAGPSADTVVADTTGPDWEAGRQALLDRSLSLAEMLARRNLILRSDLLRPWSRWITPAVEPRRFDARFFAAALPAGQRTRDVGGEAAAVQWISPAQALDAGRAGQIQLWLPTAMTLAELAEYPDAEAVLAAERDVQPLLPEIVVAEGATWLKVPGEREYPL
ncbi:MAG TPA: NUDIX hydrolase [Streptosporangiaceae bacterium]|nr:NUDIX hydrolase [Streptosporangiaceae bacterium]